MVWFKQASFWYTLIAIMAFGAILALDYRNLQSANQINIVRIVPDQNEQEESFTSLVQETSEVNEALKALFDRLIALPYEQLTTADAYLSLSELDRKHLQLMLGRYYYEQKQYEDVVAVLQSFSDDERTTANTQFIFAFALSRIAKYGDAALAYEALLARQPNSQAARLNLALLFKKQDDCTRAVPLFLHTAEISSGQRKAKALAGAGLCYLATNNHQEAVEYLRKSIEYRPNSASTWMALGRALSSAGQSYQAVNEAMERGVNLDQGNYLYHNMKARYQIANLDYRQAITSLNTSLKLQRTASTYQLKAWAYLELGKRNDAKKALRKGIKVAGTKKLSTELVLMQLYLNKKYDSLLSKTKGKKNLSNEMAYLRGLAYRKQGRFKRALSTFNSIKSASLLSWRREVQETRILRSRRQYGEASLAYAQLLERNPNAEFLHFEHALTLESQQRIKAATDEIGKALALTPDNKVYLLTQARLLYKGGQTEQSILTLNKLLNQQPHYLRALSLQAEIYMAQGRDDALLTTYSKMIRLDPDNANTQYLAASLLFKKEELKQAEQHLTQLLESHATHAKGRFLLAQVYRKTGREHLAIDQLNKLNKLTTDSRSSKN